MKSIPFVAAALLWSVGAHACEPQVTTASSTTTVVSTSSTAVTSIDQAVDVPPVPPQREPRITEPRDTRVPPAPPSTDPPVVGVYQHPNPLVERWHQAALDAGWPEAQWPRVSCIISRESGGQPDAHNPRDPGYGSFGLMQLNLSKGQYGTWAWWGPSLGWDMTRLFDGPTNLRYARLLYERADDLWGKPWQPWGPGGC